MPTEHEQTRRQPAVIDLSSRRHLAEGLRHLAAGRITNQDFERRYARSAMRSKDPGVRHIYETAWHLYSDFETYRLIGDHRLDRKTRREVARCILFLRSMRPYEWPAPSRWNELAWLPVHLVTLGLSSRLQRNRWCKSGEFSVWPFRRWTDYRAALRVPVYLRGQRP